ERSPPVLENRIGGRILCAYGRSWILLFPQAFAPSTHLQAHTQDAPRMDLPHGHFCYVLPSRGASGLQPDVCAARPLTARKSHIHQLVVVQPDSVQHSQFTLWFPFPIFALA
ncbi:hypothetical protein AVEN_131694-1, partial [Araneus ventricosus]